ncbi:MAG: MinD/ParA family protein [Desulfobacterales bacterium]|nr:MinD/ParA family protein [Desulfobacterales bacterium]
MPQGPRVISVTSGKGGVGKTNIVANLAVSMAKQGKKVLIFDADLGLANIDIIFNMHPRFNIGHVIRGEKNLNEVIVHTSHGIGIVPAGSGFVNLTQLENSEKLHLLSEFDSLDQEIDVMLIDTGAGISNNVIYFNLAADECIVVATFEPTSITDAYAMIKVMSTEHNTKYFKLLVNMVSQPEEAKSVYGSISRAVDRFLNNVILEYVGFIPIDTMLPTSVIRRKPVVELFPNAVSSKTFMQLSASLLASPRRFESNGNIKFFLKKMMNFTKN